MSEEDNDTRPVLPLDKDDEPGGTGETDESDDSALQPGGAEETDESSVKSDTESVRRNVGSWLLAPVAVVMVLLCLQRWASVSFGLGGIFAGEVYHLYLNGFGVVSTDISDAPKAPGNGSSLGAWLVCGFALVLLVAGVLRGLRRFSRPAGIASVVAAVGQIASVVYSAIVVHSQSGDFFHTIARNASLSGIRVTFSVGWALWLELLFGFLALALAIGVLVRARNPDALRIRL